MQITNQAYLAGNILADGEAGDSYSAGGSGGAIRIEADVIIADAGGLLRANGANNGGGNAGGGAGGRISLLANQFTGTMTLRMQVLPGNGHAFTYRSSGHPRGARYGSIYLSDISPVRSATSLNGICGVLCLDELSDWEFTQLDLDQSTLGFPTGVRLHVEGNLLLSGTDSGLLIHEGSLSIAGNLSMGNGSRLYLHAAPTNNLTSRYGLRLSVDGLLTLTNNAWIFPYSSPTNGGSVFMSAGALNVAENGGINADFKGFSSTRGPGAGESNQGAGGGGHGGRGGDGRYRSGGSEVGTDLDMALTLPGSGGGSHGDTFRVGGYGGGLIEMAVAGDASILGTLSANGETGRGWAGGGAGGAIWLRCGNIISSASTLLRANGGNGGSPEGGGGGGRVVVWHRVPEEAVDRFIANPQSKAIRMYPYPSFNGNITVTAGTGYTSTQEDGSRLFSTVQGTLFLFR